MEGFAVELKINPEYKALWKHMLALGSSMAADSRAFTSSSPDIHKTHYSTSVLGETHLWIASAHVNKVCNVTVMRMSRKCTMWNMSVSQVSCKCPVKAGCRPESHFYWILRLRMVWTSLKNALFNSWKANVRNLGSYNQQTQGYKGSQINKDTEIMIRPPMIWWSVSIWECRKCVIVSKLSCPIH